jgi:hypothetical protein
MGDVIAFRPVAARPPAEDDECDVDILTALDVAIRDLRDIAADLTSDAARRQAEACRMMLERAYARESL